MSDIDTVTKTQLIDALATTYNIAHSWTHDQLDGTSYIDDALAELEPARLLLEACRPAPMVEVELFKPSGKFYTLEAWRIPEDALGPHDMDKSPDFRRIDDGAVLISGRSPWGYPHLFPQVFPMVVTSHE